MRFLLALAFFFIIILWSSCRKDFEADPSTGNLEFSTDTLFLDTIFTNIGSSTYSFKVYNRTNNDLEIPLINLERGDDSNYRLNVDGIPGTSFENIQVLAKDSIFVFVETTTDITQETAETEFLYTDRILFDPNGDQQDIDLVTLIKDAVFLFPDRNEMTGEIETLLLGTDENNQEIRIEGFFLDEEELTFTNEKPYVIYGYAAIPPGQTLTIDAGARIHFHEGSGLIASNTSTLLINGELSTDPEVKENEVIFEADRLEPLFSDVPGQWGLIWLTSGSTGHRINHTTIKNATVGLLVDPAPEGALEPVLDIKNTQLYNHALYGILSRNGSIIGENLVLNTAGTASFAASLGGNYEFNHCTFANDANNGNDRLTVSLDNFLVITDDNGNVQSVEVRDLAKADFTNCIIYGFNQIELGLARAEEAAFNFSFENSLIKFDDPFGNFEDNPLYNFEDTGRYRNIILNGEPDFKDIRTDQLMIGNESAANGAASTPGAGTDILGKPRSTTAPDIGAYESVNFDMDN